MTTTHAGLLCDHNCKHRSSLVNHASQPAEESLAKMRTSSRAELSPKIVDI